jgi:GTPase SAR1 family protein
LITDYSLSLKFYIINEINEFSKEILKKCNIIILTYSIDNIASFKSLQNKWLKEVKTYSTDCPLIFLLGTKSDLRISEEKLDLISYEEGDKLYKEVELDGFYEASVNIENNLKLIFHKILYEKIKFIEKNKKKMSSVSMMEFDVKSENSLNENKKKNCNIF